MIVFVLFENLYVSNLTVSSSFLIITESVFVYKGDNFEVELGFKVLRMMTLDD